MKSKLLMLFFCYSICLFSFSQNQIIDSLLKSSKTSKADTAQARLFNEIGMQLEPINPDSAIFFYNKTISLINKNNKLASNPGARILQAQAMLNIGWVLCVYKSQFDSAVCVSEKSIKLFSAFQQTSDKILFVKVHKGIAACYTNIGGSFYYRGDYENAIEYYKKSLEMYQKLHDSKDAFAYISGCEGLSNGNMNIGVLYFEQGNYPQALQFYQKALKINEELYKSSDKAIVVKSKRAIANCYTNIALVFSDQGESLQAIEYDEKAMVIYNELGDKNGISQTFNNIGLIYSANGSMYRIKGNAYESKRHFSIAIDYFQKSLKLKEELGNRKGVCSCYNNIGGIYGEQENYPKAIEYFQKAVIIAVELEDKSGLSISYGNIADLNIKLAESSSTTAQKKIACYLEALKYGKLAFDLSKEINAIPYVNSNAGSLLKAYKATGKTGKALEFAEIFIATRDSMFQTEKTEAVIQMEKKYQAEKKQQEIEKQQLQLSKKDAEIKEQQAVSSRQKIIILFVVCGLLLVMVILFIIYRMFRQKKKTNEIITLKNNELEQANEEIRTQRDVVTQQKEQIQEIYEEITDSIHYAERIQKAVLPSDEYLKNILNCITDNHCVITNDNCITTNDNCIATNDNSIATNDNCITTNDNSIATNDNSCSNYFILYKPRNIVSGDFYWVHKRNNWLLIAVADCTGHGVPGAFMSMLGVSLLNEIASRSEITQADQLLNELRTHVISSLQQRGIEQEQKDGMDIGFIAINTDTLEMQFAGANNPIYIVGSQQSAVSSQELTANSQLLDRVSELSDCEPACPDNLSRFIGKSVIKLIELKPDKQPIGIHSDMQPFTNQRYQLHKGEIIYLMSDGFEDQFGGPNRKKYLAKNLKNLLIANNQKPMANQKQILETTITEWIGTGEQIDDITVMGIKI